MPAALVMHASLPTIHLARHGETAWSATGQHTGLTDLPLTPRGEAHAAKLGERLQRERHRFALVLTSPLQRAARTCALAGFGEVAQVEPDLVEWNYGDYEGLRRSEILQRDANWDLFRDGCPPPNGESPAQVAARAARVISRVRQATGDVLIFSSGHILRMLASGWINADPMDAARRLALSTASLSTLGYEHDLASPAILLWNDVSHLTS